MSEESVEIRWSGTVRPDGASCCECPPEVVSYLPIDGGQLYTVMHPALGEPRGRVLLKRELRAKGVDGEIIDTALEELLGPEDEERAALEYLRRGRARWTGLAEHAARRRIWSALARRGFPPPICRAAIVQFAQESGIPVADESWE